MTTKTGALNFGLIPTLKARLLPSDCSKCGYGVELLRGLHLLEKSPGLRDKLAAVREPTDRNSQSNQLIWQALNLPIGSPISHVDAKRVALAAILSHLRQGQVGSCFATFLGIEVMRSRLGRCLDDLQQILRDGKLSVIDEEGVEEDHPILLRISHDDGNNAFTFDREGRLESGAFLWEAPGLRSACLRIGIPESAITSTLKKTIHLIIERADSGTTDYQMKTHNFLKWLTEQVAKEKGGIADNLYQSLVMGFEGQTANSVLRIWEYVLASMAEARNDSLLRERTFGAVSEALALNLQKIAPGKKEHTKEILGVILKIFLDRASIKYDPSLTAGGASADGHSTSGGFILYDSNRSSSFQKWTRIDRAADFLNFIKEVVSDAEKEMATDRTDPYKSALAAGIFTSFKRYLDSPTNEFLKMSVCIFNYGKYYPDLTLPDFDKLEHTPWLNQMGNLPDSVWKVYFGKDMVSYQKIRPLNAVDLMTRLVQLFKKGTDSAKNYFRANPQVEIPVRTTGQHAFSLIPGDPSFKAVWDNPEFSREWICEQIEKPGLLVADSVLEAAYRERILHSIRESMIDKKNHELFDKERLLLPADLTLQQFRDKTVSLVEKINKISLSNRNALRLQIDSSLFRLLPDSMRGSLIEHSVKFADTNWNKGAHDLDFSFIYNPFSKNVEVWLSYDDNSRFFAVDQNAWVKRPWELSVNVHDPLPEEGEEVAVVDRKLDLSDLIFDQQLIA